MGDLPTQNASQQAAGGVGNADACLIFIRPPPGDREPLRMPKNFHIGEDRIHISRPGQRPATHTQPLTADSQIVTHREGPRTIRTRQRVQRAARRAAAAEPRASRPAPAAGPPDAALLQGLPFRSHLHPQPGPSVGSLLQGLQLPVLRLQIVGFPAHIARQPVLGPRSARSCRLLRPL